MQDRSIEDQLREQYFDLLPIMTVVAADMKTRVEYALLPVNRALGPHENLQVKVRVKDCASAIDKLRQFNPLDPSAERNPGGVFDPEMPGKYTLLSLRDLVGLRVLVFPSQRAIEVDERLRALFPEWVADPIVDNGQQLGFKYNGNSIEFGTDIPCEYQIVSTLVGLFWETEHAAIYKLAPSIKRNRRFLKAEISEVYKALRSFEAEFERQLQESTSN
jgi:hypothetical protein